MIIRKTVLYSDINSASDPMKFAVGKDLIASGVVNGVSAKIITPFMASDGSRFTFAVGEASFPERFLTCDATQTGIFQTNGVDTNDVWFQGDDSTTTSLTVGIDTDATTPYTQGEALVSYDIDEDVVDL